MTELSPPQPELLKENEEKSPKMPEFHMQIKFQKRGQKKDISIFTS